MARPPEGRAAHGDLAGGFVTVIFGDGRTARLDLTDYRSRVWARVLQSLRETGQPAYVEISPDTGLITELLQPMRFTVGAMRNVDDGLEIDLVVSQARHYLSRRNRDFAQLRRALVNARTRGTPLLVTETLNEHEIIHVQPAEPTATPRR
jgi:hypothetical protein